MWSHSTSSINFSYFLTWTLGHLDTPGFLLTSRAVNSVCQLVADFSQSSRIFCFSLQVWHGIWSYLNTEGRRREGKGEKRGERRDGGRKERRKEILFSHNLWQLLSRQFHQIVSSKLFLNLYKNSYRWNRMLCFNTLQYCVMFIFTHLIQQLVLPPITLSVCKACFSISNMYF